MLRFKISYKISSLGLIWKFWSGLFFGLIKNVRNVKWCKDNRNQTRPDTGQNHGLGDIWIFGYLNIWIHGYLNIWIFVYLGFMDILIFEYLDIWMFGYLDIWIFGLTFYAPLQYIVLLLKLTKPSICLYAGSCATRD